MNDDIPWTPARSLVEEPVGLVGVRVPDLVVVDPTVRVQVIVGNYIIVDCDLATFAHSHEIHYTAVLLPGVLFRVLLLSDVDSESRFMRFDITTHCEWQILTADTESVVAEMVRASRRFES